MPDVLIIHPDNAERFKLEELVSSKGVRFKSAIDTDGAVQWLQNWNFDLAIADPSIAVNDQQRIADLLWRANPAARFLNIREEGPVGGREIEGRLFGAEVLKGPDALAAAGKIIERLEAKGIMELENFKILVVEDLDAPRDIICSFIENIGFSRVVGVSSAKQALDRLTGNTDEISCVVTDIRMPSMSGSQLIEQIRMHAKLQGLPIIVLTAYGSPNTLLDCLKAGASGFLVKPPKRDDLARELGRAYRIVRNKLHPRLAVEGEIDAVREVLEKKGFI